MTTLKDKTLQLIGLVNEVKLSKTDFAKLHKAVFELDNQAAMYEKLFELLCVVNVKSAEREKHKTLTFEVALDEGAILPTKAHSSDAGFDLYTPFAFDVQPHKAVVIDTGVHLIIPGGYVGFIKSRSGLNVKFGILSEGVIDAGYTGSIVAKLYNNSDEPKHFCVGDKITQIVILPIPDVALKQVKTVKVTTERGNNGFGSSGR